MQPCCRLSGGACRSCAAQVPSGQMLLLLWRVGVPAGWPAVRRLGAVPAAAAAGFDSLRTMKARRPGRGSRDASRCKPGNEHSLQNALQNGKRWLSYRDLQLLASRFCVGAGHSCPLRLQKRPTGHDMYMLDADQVSTRTDMSKQTQTCQCKWTQPSCQHTRGCPLT